MINIAKNGEKRLLMLLTTVSRAKLTAELHFIVQCGRNYREYKISGFKFTTWYSSLHTFYHKISENHFFDLSHKDSHNQS